MALLAGGLGSTAFTVATASIGHTGSIPTSGPTADGGFGGGFGNRAGIGGFGGAGGRGGEAAASSDLVALLQQTTTKWSAATNGSNSAAALELASGTNVIAMGGFSGSDPFPSLDQFKTMVSNGEISYYIAGGGMGGGGFGGRGGSDTSAITQWVESNFQAISVGSTTVYKLVK
jgi:hypothetical protein